MANFCTNCGFKLGRDDNFCTNCGTKVDKSDMRQNNPYSNQYSDSMEKKKAKKELKRVVGGGLFSNKTFVNALIENGLNITIDGNAIRKQVEKEIDSGKIKSGGVEFRVNQLVREHKIRKEEERKKLKMIDEMFESAEIKLEISKNDVDQTHVASIKEGLKNKIIDKNENMSEDEIKYYIKEELTKAGEEIKKARIEREKAEKARIEREKEMMANKRTRGGYCGLGCIHCYEEFLDSGGGIVGDFDSEGCVEYYCRLGHSASHGSFCEDYE